MKINIEFMILSKMKFLTISILFMSVYTVLFYIFLEVWYLHRNKSSKVSPVVLPYVVVHLDLKGSPPKLSYLNSILPMLKKHGVNGLLVEYEDMFPYEGKLVNLSARNCYKKSELANFLTLAVKSGFEIIPLIQTFGHMEHALKLKEFQLLRESPLHPDSICPSKTESLILIKNMLEQVILFHENVLPYPLKHVHIGCDEVFHINSCEQCIDRNITNINIFLQHIKHVKDIVSSISPNTTVLIWDDMLRSTTMIESNKINFIKDIEPVYWDYKTSVTVSHANMFKYHTMFANIWIASAFKGADGRIAVLPDLPNRFLNHISWLNFIRNYKFGGEDQIYNFKGVILTGWSRYSHMDPPCELLPAAIPSLTLNLILIKKYSEGIVIDEYTQIEDDFFNQHIQGDFNKSLECHHVKDLYFFNSSLCAFDGSKIYSILKQYRDINLYIQEQFHNIDTALSAIEYYAKINIVNVNRAQISLTWCEEMLSELLSIEINLSKAMKQYYDKEFIEEYVNFRTFNTKKILVELLSYLKKYVQPQTWERGPTNNVSAIMKKYLTVY